MSISQGYLIATCSKLLDRLVCLRNYLLDGAVSLLPRTSLRPAGKAAILVVRLDAIGDFVLWLDAASALRSIYPPERYRLVLVANALWAELAVGLMYFDEVIWVNTKRLHSDIRYRIQMWQRLRSRSWDTVINPTYSRHMPYDDAVVRVCGARQRIGSHGDSSNQRAWEKRLSDRWYSQLIPASGKPLMELERNAEFLRGLGLPDFRAGVPALVVTAEAPIDLAVCGYYLVVPSASLPIKQWPVEKFAELMTRIRNQYGLKAVVCGAPGEEELGLRLQRLVSGGDEEIEVHTGTTSLTQFAAMIKGALFVVANDSSAIHIAAAVGTRALCIVGGAHYGRFVPYLVEGPVARPLPVTIAHRMECYHCNLKCRFHLPEGTSAPCLEEIGVADVLSQVRLLLDGALLKADSQ